MPERAKTLILIQKNYEENIYLLLLVYNIKKNLNVYFDLNKQKYKEKKKRKNNVLFRLTLQRMFFIDFNLNFHENYSDLPYNEFFSIDLNFNFHENGF